MDGAPRISPPLLQVLLPEKLEVLFSLPGSIFHPAGVSPGRPHECFVLSVHVRPYHLLNLSARVYGRRSHPSGPSVHPVAVLDLSCCLSFLFSSGQKVGVFLLTVCSAVQYLTTSLEERPQHFECSKE